MRLTPAEYIEAVIELGKAHGYSLGHEDHEGGFYIDQYYDHYADWMRGFRVKCKLHPQYTMAPDETQCWKCQQPPEEPWPWEKKTE